ncbi:hypothetical protein [Paenibacillus illinoisensis]|uniref:Uncharacterized protein n=1 Tax=Paenibacillus illinoisensis TaxID=59845 RepID=A0A2W0C6X7_9BACL|nr:hypothetical protein [Paenibacillus illinoisensis]PYY28210.1 Uncharacterized protein PIL02S_03356 [Paenibacillus illinoisensis]
MTTTYTRVDSLKDQYPHFSDAIKERFAEYADLSLFTTDADGLFEAYLNGLPEHARQHYNCNCCLNFINRFGGLVSINDKGEVSSVMWDETQTPNLFIDSVKAMKKIVHKSKVNGVFISSERTLGTPTTNGWDHMSVNLPTNKVHTSRLKTAGQEMAEKKEDYRILIAGLREFPEDVVQTAVNLLESETMYRSDRVLGVAKFLKELHAKRLDTSNGHTRDNITWLAVANAPSGFCHVKSSMIGTLLEDIVAGFNYDAISRRFAEKMNPANYMRSQSAPTQGNIQQAEKIVAQLGIAESLRRRYARYDEIPTFLWQDKGTVAPKVEPKKSVGVFGGITPKGNQSNSVASDLNLPTTVMTWDKFQRTLLPTADVVEVLTNNANKFMALVTAADESAPNILQWDNTVSWYYHGGIDSEIKRRVETAGGQYENVEIRCSLIWDSYTDLDIHCRTPRGSHIYYGTKRAHIDGGMLDVDANVSPDTLTPVENIRWANGRAPEGTYKFYVNNFTERGKGSTPFKVELEINGKIYTFSGTVGSKEDIVAFEFDYVKGNDPVIRGVNHTSENAWNIPTNSFVKVKGITNSPNLWNNDLERLGNHIFFILEDCKDLSEGKGRGFFTETLKPELREARKTLEAYTANTPIEGVEEASASGVGYSKDGEWNLTLKVSTGNSTRLIKIDRWD